MRLCHYKFGIITLIANPLSYFLVSKINGYLCKINIGNLFVYLIVFFFRKIYFYLDLE